MKAALLDVAPRYLEDCLPLPETAKIIGAQLRHDVSGGALTLVIEDPSLTDILDGAPLPWADIIVTRNEDGSIDSVLSL